MVSLGNLFKQKNYNDPNWELTKENFNVSIDVAMARGNVDKEVLLIMKELLNSCKPSIVEYTKDYE